MTISASARLISILIGMLLIVVACGGNDDTADADPSDVIDQAADRFAETESARFALEIDGSIPIDDQGMLSLSAVEGAFERPASAQADATVQFGGSRVTMEIVVVDNEMHIRNVLTGGWERAPTDLQFDPARIFDEDDGIPAILRDLDDLETEGQESIQGEDAWHVTGTLRSEVVQRLTGDFFEGEDLDVELWVAESDHRILRVELEDTSGDGTSWQLDLFDHDDDVNIIPPEVD